MNSQRRENATQKVWRVRSIQVAVDATEEEVRAAAAKRLGLEAKDLLGFRMVRRSLDLRGQRAGRPARFVIQAECVCPAGHRGAALARSQKSGKVVEAPALAGFLPDDLAGARPQRVVVVGSGPAGLFAALPLARLTT